MSYKKILKAIVFEHNSGAKRIAQRFLSRVHSRYSPEFIWPRSLNTVEVRDRRKFEWLRNDDSVLRELEEAADGVQIKLLDDGTGASNQAQWWFRSLAGGGAFSFAGDISRGSGWLVTRQASLLIVTICV